MARLILLQNPLAPYDREEAELAPGQAVIDWLQEHYPNGCGPNGEPWPLRFFVNGQELELDNLDLVPEPDDIVLLAVVPGFIALVTAVVTAIITAALSFVIGLIFAERPSVPGFADQQSSARDKSTVYDVRAQQNAARIGEPIPVAYGQVLTVPDYAMQPHRWYDNNNDVWLDSLMVLSQGEVDVQEVLLGDTNVNSLMSGTFWWAMIPPWRHQQTLGNLGFFSNFYENVVTCPEVDGQRFENTGDSAGYFRLSKTGFTGRYITFDLEWPGGLFEQQSWGPTGNAVDFNVIVQQVDAAGNFTGYWQQFFFTEARFWGLDVVRQTYSMDMGFSSSWAAALFRSSNQHADGRHIDAFKWSGLKLYADLVQYPVYGNVTLLAVRIKASQGIGDGQQQIRVRMTRRLPILGAGPLQATTNPADALVDIYTNMDYGARRPRDELDLGKLNQLWHLWNGYQFGAVYTGATTVWQALVQSVQGMAAAPLPLGSFLSVAQDGIKPARSMLFTEQNISRDSFVVSYDFDKVGANDGVEVEYREPTNFSPAYARVPSSSVDPEKIVLFGCVEARHAFQYARLTWNRRLAQRKTLEFATELEGLIPYPGERVAVSHTLPQWGISGFVADASGSTVTVDRDLPWETTTAPYAMMFRTAEGEPSTIVTVTRGSWPNVAILGAPPLGPDGLPIVFHVGDRQENTHFVFGSSSTMVRDFVLTELRPKTGSQVTLAGLVYNPNIFAGTLDFLAGPVP